MLFLSIGLAVALVVLLILAAMDVYWPIGAAIVLVAAVGVTFYSFPLWMWVAANWWLIFVYFLIGLPWLFFRWTRFVEKEFRKARNNKNYRDNIPQWAYHKWSFAPYYTYWPIDFVVYFLNNFLRDVWDFVSRMVSETFDRYARWRFSKLTGGL